MTEPRRASFECVVDAFEDSDRLRTKRLRDVARALQSASKELAKGQLANGAYISVEIAHALELLRRAGVDVD